MSHKIIVLRYSSDVRPNMAAALALKPHYDPQRALAIPTPMAMVSVFMSNSTPEDIFLAMSQARCGCQFTVIETNEQDIPIKILSSVTVADAPSGFTQEQIDSTKTLEDLHGEFNTLLDKVRDHGRDSLSEIELARLAHLSQMEF